MQREESFTVSKPPPIFFGVLSILLIFILVIAAIMYLPEPQSSGRGGFGRRIDWPPRYESVLHQLKDSLHPIWSHLWLLLMILLVALFFPVLSYLVLHRKRHARSSV
jgi:hypothetical protein